MNPLEMVKPATTGGFSFFELFMQAGPVVKIVMFGLLLASIWAWAIIIEKLFAFRRARREADRFEQQFWSGQSLDELYSGLSRGRTFSMASLFVAAMREWKRSVEGNIRAMGGIQLRVEKVMDVTISREMEQLDRRLLFLATVGSTAPFIGLFGTVWGIMTSFQAIAASKNTNLAVVAPGIAEALFATALGLLAAIPAVVFYNKFAADSSRLSPAARGLRRRVLGHRLAPDRRAHLRALMTEIQPLRLRVIPAEREARQRESSRDCRAWQFCGWIPADALRARGNDGAGGVGIPGDRAWPLASSHQQDPAAAGAAARASTRPCTRSTSRRSST